MKQQEIEKLKAEIAEAANAGEKYRLVWLRGVDHKEALKAKLYELEHPLAERLAEAKRLLSLVTVELANTYSPGCSRSMGIEVLVEHVVGHQRMVTKLQAEAE